MTRTDKGGAGTCGSALVPQRLPPPGWLAAAVRAGVADRVPPAGRVGSTARSVSLIGTSSPRSAVRTYFQASPSTTRAVLVT